MNDEEGKQVSKMKRIHNYYSAAAQKKVTG